MIVLSHRGYWSQTSEMNSLEAFRRSFGEGFGAELDIRDMNGILVVSHDPPTGSPLRLEDLFAVYRHYNSDVTLALNIKSDGLQGKLRQLLEDYLVRNYFVFDMSVPEGLRYCDQGFKTFTRHSDQELVPSFYDRAHGVWLDEFHVPWIGYNAIFGHISSRKEICVVSPELHKLNPRSKWELYKEIKSRLPSATMMICTDYPGDARRFFHD